MTRSLPCFGLLAAMAVPSPCAAARTGATVMVPLDGRWSLATDPQNVGREQSWFQAPRPEAKPAKVPWIIQGTFPGYHGVAWYWRDFTAPANPHAGGRTLLRFWQVDYLAEVWLNGQPVGGHEGGETPFVLDVTAAIKPGQKNRLAVRVLNPTHEAIDGIRLYETARRCKVIPYGAGAGFNHGGITDSVELLCVPAVRVEDLFVVARPEGEKGTIHVQAGMHNARSQAVKGLVEFTVADARSGETTAVMHLARELPAGTTPIEADLAIDQPRLWQLNDPYLYRVTARVSVEPEKGDKSNLPRSGPEGASHKLDLSPFSGRDRLAFHELSARCGFRDFRFADGYFRLNGRRIYLRCTHTCNHFPIGQQFPDDPDLLRRDLINLKVMGFNAVRFIWGAASRVQLDLCDEIGLLVYQESYASMSIAPSPKMAERFDSNVRELICRDRNHPSVVIWGLLNEASDNPAFRHAVGMLPLVRSLDTSRVVMLNSGRYDGVGSGGGGIAGVAGLRIWPKVSPTEPWVALNPTKETIRALGITWPPGHLAFHPGPQNEFSVVRWTAPAAGDAEVAATFTGLAERATTDVHVLHNGRSLLDGLLNLQGSPNEARFSKTLRVVAGDRIDCVVGAGNEHYGADTTGLAVTVKAAGKTYDATADFSTDGNPNGPWSYGQLPPGKSPDAARFALYPTGEALGTVGSLSNPGTTDWQDVLSDRHFYPRVPHTAATICSLREMEGPDGQPVFLSEYGIGSAVDLWRAVRHFEQRGAERLEDAQFFNERLNRFLADWKQWRLDEAWARPEDFFMESLTKMAGQRTLGLGAIRSNPNIVSHSLTGAIDHVMCGEGLTTAFRELKPGTIDAMVDAWAPLRWCLFAEPVHVVRGAKIHLEAVLADEDVLRPGEYPARFQVVGPPGSPRPSAGDGEGVRASLSPDTAKVLDRTITVKVPKRAGKKEPPLARLCFSDDVAVDGPPGMYRFLATFERGAAAAGGSTEFYVSDPADMPAVETEVALWGDDPGLARWLAEHKVRTRPYSPLPRAVEGPGVRAIQREVILASGKPPAPGGARAFAELAHRVAGGSTVVFLSPSVFAKGEAPTAWLPLVRKGTLKPIRGWLYLKDEWAKRHPIFDGLPAGGLMDYTYYGEIIPDLVWTGQDPPAEAVAGAIKASQDYASGLMVAVYTLGEGRFVLNTLRIRENLGSHPAAERLLRNMLRWAARDAGKPAAKLPPDFEAQLKAMGYHE